MQNRNYVNVFTYIIWHAIFNTALSTKEAPKILFIFLYKVQCTNCSSYFEEKVYTLQRKKADNLKQIFPEKEYRGLSPNFHIHVSLSELYIPTMGLPFLLEEICGPIL
jgi:hypothetical protein